MDQAVGRSARRKISMKEKRGLEGKGRDQEEVGGRRDMGAK
jgi:hypothetical protein